MGSRPKFARLPTTATAAVFGRYSPPARHNRGTFTLRSATGSYPGPCGRLSPVEMRICRNAQDAFDAVGIVVDWIDACKQQRLDVLLDLYDDAATIECCEGGTIRGRSAMEWYWRSKLAGPAARAFEIDALCPEPDGVSLDYRGYYGKQ